MRVLSRSFRWVVIAGSISVAANASAQSVPVGALKPANTKLAEEFTNIYGMRELRDGRVLISESGLLVVDFAKGTIDSIGRRGKGPGEFDFAAGLYAIGGDSTLMDAGQKKWLLLDGARIVATSKPDDPAALATWLVHGADRLGFVLTSSPGTWRDDSTSRALVSRSTGTLTLVAKLSASMEPGYPPKPTPKGGGVAYYQGAWKTSESDLLFPDGWLAVARLSPYRVDWRAPDGHWILGKPLPVILVKVDEREKRGYMERLAAERGAAVQPTTTYATWPKNIPPFSARGRTNGLVAAPDGKLLVPSTQTVDHPETRYDVIDRNGRLERQLILKANERILGSGARSVYVIVVDDDGIQRVQRHPWP